MTNFPTIELTFAQADDAAPDDAVLREGVGAPSPGVDYFTAAPMHAPGCACCAARNGAGLALSRLLLARAHGRGPFFRRVVVVTVSAAGREAVLQALATDTLASACFSLGKTAVDGVSHVAADS